MTKLILIGGISRSGKTSLSLKLIKDLPKTLLLHQDNYTLPKDALPKIRDRIDWEKPETIDWKRLIDAYDQSVDEFNYIIIEGIFAFSNRYLIEKASLTVMLSLDHEEFLRLRTQETRWGNEPSWFLQHVWKSHIALHNPFNTQPNILLKQPSHTDYEHLLLKIKTVTD